MISLANQEAAASLRRRGREARRSHREPGLIVRVVMVATNHAASQLALRAGCFGV